MLVCFQAPTTSVSGGEPQVNGNLMMNRQVTRSVLHLLSGTVAVVAIACSNSPTVPTAAPRPLMATPFGVLTPGTLMPGTLAACLGGSGDASCFTAGRLRTRSTSAGSALSAPVFNNNQPVLNSGPTVTLAWTAPAGTPVSYVVEASDVPGGPANLANFNTGSAATTLVVPNVPVGVYYVRIRAVDASGASAPSNEVQLIVASTAGSCPSAPIGLTIASLNGGTVTLAWSPPASGVPSSYVVKAGSAAGLADLANFDTGTTATSLAAAGVGVGTYYVRVYAKSNACQAPTFTGPASNELVLTISPPGWSGQIVCVVDITGPNSYFHHETQTWTVTGPGQTSGGRTTLPTVWASQGSGGGIGKSWTINVSVPTTLTETVIASTGLPTFNRTTSLIVVPNGMVGTPVSFPEYEQDFPPFSASSPTATVVTGTWSRPTVGGDSPQQPGGSVGTLSCTWTLTYR